MNPRRVEIEWLDSESHGSPWAAPRDVINAPAMVCQSIGYLVRDDDEAVTIAQSFHLDELGSPEEYGHALTIPRVSLIGQPRDLRR